MKLEGKQATFTMIWDTIRVYDAQTGKLVWTLNLPTRGSLPHFSPNGSLVAFQEKGPGGMVHVYDTRTGQKTLALNVSAGTTLQS